ncbi:SGNH/GDSL hydrolase family protein [Oribacterium sp. P6A1]|uniref:SGNH/GDSL hydrolase family protein n=1 Tax=Oribacterium sp. P6A1 TaxID=1410612 RepID=UPI00056195A8|nr:SGNH/GDSL hydrolase family protein [Oribacterium sp. P6A1]
MINVLLLGDSIRLNYQEEVARLLNVNANVVYPKDNGRFCLYTLRYIHEWIKDLSPKDGEFDIVHFNCGLWDVLRLSNESGPMISEELYHESLVRIVERIRFMCPGVKIIFALTTSVKEPGFEPGIEIGERRNQDIVRYNEIAKGVFNKMGIDINDLWEVSKKIPDDARSDQVHFDTDKGRMVLADAVAMFIKQRLI